MAGQEEDSPPQACFLVTQENNISLVPVDLAMNPELAALLTNQTSALTRNSHGDIARCAKCHQKIRYELKFICNLRNEANSVAWLTIIILNWPRSDSYGALGWMVSSTIQLNTHWDSNSFKIIDPTNF